MDKLIKQAFTLIELLVVIAIIGILSGLIIVSMNGVTEKANIAKSQVFSNSLRNALMINLVFEVKLDEGAGTVIVDSWKSNTGNLVNFNFDATDGWRTETNCIYGSCLLFDGSNDYISISESENMKTDNITIEAWINPTIVTNGSPVRTTITNKFYLGFHLDGSFAWHVRKSDGTGSYAYSNTVVSTNKWHHITATYKSQSFQRFYIDGIKVADISNITWSPLVVVGSYGWAIGASDWGAGGNYYKGIIDNVRIYNDAVSISQIREQYYLGLNRLLINRKISSEEYTQRLKEVKLSVK
jgi:prepilin-type N-terminal cleavage/methylation domain-containing protein